MALTFIPYRFHGLRRSFRTKYRISEGYAEILKLRPSGWLVVQRLPLEEISTKIEDTKPQKLLGRGNIKITAVSGETMLWESLKNIKAAQEALYNWKMLDVPDPMEILGPESQTEEVEFWRKLPKGIQEFLVHNGFVTIDMPNWRKGYDYLYFLAVLKEMRKCPSSSARKQRLQLLITEAGKEQDIQLQRFALAPIPQTAALAQSLASIEKQATTVMDTMATYFLLVKDVLYHCFEDLNWDEFNKEDRDEISKLRDNAKEKFDKFIEKVVNERDKKKLIENLRNVIHSRKIELENKVITVQVHSDSYLYAHRLFNSSRHKHKAEGDWVEYGESLCTYNPEGVSLRSPVSGFVISGAISFGNLGVVEVIPQKNYKLPDKVGELVFGEFVDYLDKSTSVPSSTRGNPEYVEYIQKVLEEVKNFRPIEKEIDEEMKLMIEAVKNNSRL